MKYGKRPTQNTRRKTKKHLDVLDIVLKKEIEKTKFEFHRRQLLSKRQKALWNVTNVLIKRNSSEIIADPQKRIVSLTPLLTYFVILKQNRSNVFKN